MQGFTAAKVRHGRTRKRFASPALLLVAAIACAGCGEPAQHRRFVGNPSAIHQPAEDATTNIYSRPAGEADEIATPASVRRENQIELGDLGMVLRSVTFAEPIDGKRQLFFSETEITNQMFAKYLTDTNQWRDDTRLEEEEERRSRGTELANGAHVLSFSTGDPAIDIERNSSLWRGGKHPAGEEDYPVTFITTRQAMDFCQWLTTRYGLGGEFRLPKEKEWLFAAYGQERQYPWGNEQQDWTSKSTAPVQARPDLRTPDGLFGMWGNVSELVLSDSNGYGGRIRKREPPMITVWLGHSYAANIVRGKAPHPRQEYWGYTHSPASRSDAWGFRVVFEPAE